MNNSFKRVSRDAFMSSMNTGCTRSAPTLPPPPPGATAHELDQRAADLRKIAAQILARANDLDSVAAAMRGGR